VRYFIKTLVNSVWTPQEAATCTAPAAATAQPPLIVVAGQPLIRDVRITNVRDVSFAVSWLTDEPTTGAVRFGASPKALNDVAYDDRGAGAVAATHHVTLRNLSPDTLYYFALVSGESVSGDVYSVTTGPMLSIPRADSIYGRVLLSDGVTPAAGALVYLTLQDSDPAGSRGQADWLSALADATGYWIVNLGSARTQDRTEYFAYTAADGLSLAAWYNPSVHASQATVAGQAAPAPVIVLSGGQRMYLPLVVER